MKLQSHIPKLNGKLLPIIMCIFTVLLVVVVNTSTVYAADDPAQVIADAVVASYNGTHSDNRGGDSHIVNGVAYTRTGYLCYLLTKDGSPTGLPAYAFYSPGYNGIAGSQWVCTSRRGQSVSGWKEEAPWNTTPWGNRGTPSYEPEIRDWFLDASSGVTNAQIFVKRVWGLAAAKNFESDNYILVIETIMNFQYSVKGGNGGNSGIDADAILKACTTEAANYVNSIDPTELNQMLSSLHKTKKEWTEFLASMAYLKVVAQLGGNAGTNRTFTSPPLIGTVPNLITYKKGNTVFDSYTNKVAPHSEKIKVNEAGFTAYTGTGALSDAEVQSYGVAMLIIHCKSDAIHTYWEPHGSPGNPEPRIPGKTGTCNIVKGYYKENLTTGAKQSLGVYYELDVTSNIIVSGEPTFELVEWRVTTATSTGVNPIAWNPPGTTSQQGKAGATLSLKDPEDCVYVLLF